MNYLDREMLCMILQKSRTEKDLSQREMAHKMHKSIGTIQNWEYGTSSPDVVELMDWFKALGLNPLRYILNFVHPDVYEKLDSDTDIEDMRDSLMMWVSDIATDAEIRKMAFNIYGGTGSSWSSQVDEWCALNHLPIVDRVGVASIIYNLYIMKESTGELRGMDRVKPDMTRLKNAIDKCIESVREGKDDYTN